jgi:hypothetical protein
VRDIILFRIDGNYLFANRWITVDSRARRENAVTFRSTIATQSECLLPIFELFRAEAVVLYMRGEFCCFLSMFSCPRIWLRSASSIAVSERCTFHSSRGEPQRAVAGGTRKQWLGCLESLWAAFGSAALRRRGSDSGLAVRLQLSAANRTPGDRDRSLEHTRPSVSATRERVTAARSAPGGTRCRTGVPRLSERSGERHSSPSPFDSRSSVQQHRPIALPTCMHLSRRLLTNKILPIAHSRLTAAHVQQTICTSIQQPRSDISTRKMASESALLPPTSATRDGNAPSSRTCAELAQRDSDEHHIHYKQYLSNHLAHGLVALHQIGATAERMEEFYVAGSKSLEPRSDKDATPLTRENFLQHVCKADWRSCLKFIQREWTRIAKEVDPEKTNTPEKLKVIEQELVAEYFPKLAPGMAGHATHPLIHTGFGLVMTENVDTPMWAHLQNGDEGRPQNPMVVTGLAYLIYQGLRLDNGTGGYSPESMQAIPHSNSKPLHTILAETIEKLSPFLEKMNQLIKESPYKERPIGDFQRKVAVVADHAAQELLDIDAQWEIIDIGLAIEQVQAAVLLLYALSNNDFFMLHEVTSFYALRHILPKLSSDADRIVALRYGLKTVLAVYVVQGMPGKDSKTLQRYAQTGDANTAAKETLAAQPEFLQQGESRGDAESLSSFVSVADCALFLLPSGWPELLSGALATNDEHTQKLIMVCHQDHLALEAVRDTRKRLSEARVDLPRFCASKRLLKTEPDDE